MWAHKNENANLNIISFHCVPPAVHIVAALMHLITSQQSGHDMAIFVIVSMYTMGQTPLLSQF